jgi:hypothetical protein
MEVEMTVSEQLTKLAARAKEAEDNVAAAQAQNKADLEQDLETARASAQAQAQKLAESAEAGKESVSNWWKEVQKNWNEHVATVQENVRHKKAEVDLNKAQHHADHAEVDAGFAIEYADAAIAEAEYAVLDALLARKQADELAATT